MACRKAQLMRIFTIKYLVKAEASAIEKAHGLPAGAIANDIHN